MHREPHTSRCLPTGLASLVAMLSLLAMSPSVRACPSSGERQPPPTRPASGPAVLADGSQGLVVLAEGDPDCCCGHQAGGRAPVSVELKAHTGQIVDATGTTAVLRCIMSQCTPGDPEENVIAWRYTYDAVITDGKFRITTDGTLELLSGTAFVRSRREPCLLRKELKMMGWTFYPLLVVGSVKSGSKGTEFLVEVFVDADGNATETRITLVSTHQERGEEALVVWVDDPDHPGKPRQTGFAEENTGQYIRASINSSAPGDRRVPDATTRAEIDAKVIQALRALSQ